MTHLFEELNKIEPIPGFKVMEWLRKVREEDYKMQQEHPKEYAAEMERIRKNMRQKALMQEFEKQAKPVAYA